jgi:hypothetical protein
MLKLRGFPRNVLPRQFSAAPLVMRRRYLIVVPMPSPRCASQVVDRGAQADARRPAQVLDRGTQADARGAMQVLDRVAQAVARGAAQVLDRGVQAATCAPLVARRRYLIAVSRPFPVAPLAVVEGIWPWCLGRYPRRRSLFVAVT